MDTKIEISNESLIDNSGVLCDDGPQLNPAESKHFLHKMVKRLNRQFNMHVDSTAYYKKMHILVTIPSIIISAFSSIAAFLATSSLISQEKQNAFALSVGIIAAISTTLQTFSSAFKYPARIESHSVAAQQYANLKTQAEFEEEIPDEDFNEFAHDLEKKIIDIQNKCNFFVPGFIRQNCESKDS
jgi:hypothetical protein